MLSCVVIVCQQFVKHWSTFVKDVSNVIECYWLLTTCCQTWTNSVKQTLLLFDKSAEAPSLRGLRACRSSPNHKSKSNPKDLRGGRILDAGCGTGVLSRMLDERGAEFVGGDIAEKLIEVAKDRSNLNKNIEYFAGDMKEESFGNFDYIIAMDSLIHYSTEDVISSIADFYSRVNNSVLFTVIPSTFVLRTKLRLGKFFPKSERSR